MRKSSLTFLALLFLSNYATATEEYSTDKLEARFSKIRLQYNSNINYDSHPNCWGTMFYLTELVSELEYLDSGPVISYFLSDSCQERKVPEGNSFVHIDSAEGPMHSYYLGLDMYAWQKFDPSEFSLIQKEPHNKVISWYQKLEQTSYSRPFRYSYFNCSKPSEKFKEIFSFYMNPEVDINRVMDFVRKELSEGSFDKGLYFMMLYATEVKALGVQYTKEELPPEMMEYSSEVDSIRNLILEKSDDYFSINALLDFYMSVEFFLKILEKINLQGGAPSIEPALLKKVIIKLERFISDPEAKDSLMSSENFANFVESLSGLDLNQSLHFLTTLVLFPKEAFASNSKIYDWMILVAEKWDRAFPHSFIEHWILFELYSNGVLKRPIFSEAPDEEFYEQKEFSLHPGFFFTESFIQGWKEDF